MDRLSVRLRFVMSWTLLALLISPLYGCGKTQSVSTLESVEIPQTPVENQFSIGFCWAYAAMGLIESRHKSKGGESLNLSEEALGFVRMREELQMLGDAYRRGRLSLDQALDATQGDGLEGWWVRRPDSDRKRDALELIDEYGVVPENLFPVKFRTADDTQQLKLAIHEPFRRLLTSGAPITLDALNQVLTADGAFPAAPPAKFDYQGKTVTATEFTRDILKFHGKDYVSLQASDATEALELIQIMKRTLAAGHSVPMSFAVSFSNLQGGFFKAPNYAVSAFNSNPNLPNSIIKSSGGHAVLVTDFVNHGGREGAIDADELQLEIEKSAEELSYVKFKNSWGATNERGINVAGGKDGYYRMDLGYIKAVAAIGFFGIVVPKGDTYLVDY